MSLNVLIIDDDRTFARALERICRRHDCQVVVAATGEEGVERACALPADVVLCDLHLPGMDGVGVLGELRARQLVCQFVILTAEPTVDTAVSALKLGAFDYLAKTAGPDEITVKVQRVLEVGALKKRADALAARGTGERQILGDHAAMHELRARIEQVASVPETAVLIQGENGVGKELVAETIHRRSARRERPFVALNCAAIPRELAESELFGHERGAFTGADRARLGVLELAEQGTLFLDEIGEMPLDLQPKLLRALEQREFRRVGGQHPLRFSARVVAATNRDLGEEIDAGRFRKDLYYRLAVFPITVPPLRERLSDLPLLCQALMGELARSLGRPLEGVRPEAIEMLEAYDFPGNVRELRNVLERAAIVSRTPWIMPDDLLLPAPRSRGTTVTKPDLEDARILQALEDAGGSKTQAALRLGISRFALLRRLKAIER